MDRMKGKTCVVTGGARGIGKGIVETFVREGAARVWALDVNPADFVAIEKAMPAVRCATVDVTDSAAVNSLVAKIKEESGRIDVLVNNAGITRDGLLIRMSDDQWRSVIEVNLTGAFLCSRAAAKVMLRQRSGRIINMASVVGVMGNAGQANYSASKAGLIGLTKSMARELASRGITVNAIAPGFIVSPMTDGLGEEAKQKLFSLIPLGRLGTPEDVADAVAFFASPAASYITGQVLKVDGGMHM